MLLVVDNCEHVVGGAAEVIAALLRAAPNLTVLATSQEQLGVPGEVVWPVDTLDNAAAVALFAARARAADRTFRLDDADRGAVEQLCRRLDGIPLALELAASRVRALDVHDLLARLDDRFRLLATGYRGRPPRQQTLRAMIDWSWDLLSDAEQVVLRRLAVHADGCTLAAADAVCADSSDLLPRLIDRSLVQTTRTRTGVRYRLLESVAAYCTTRLFDADEVDEMARRHLTYHLAAAEGADLHGPGQQRSLTLLDAESANLHVALATAIRLEDAESALRLADSLAWYWFLRGRFDEARRAFDAAIAVAGGSADRRARILAWRAGFGGPTDDLDLTDIVDPRARAFAQWFLAFTGVQAPQADSALDVFGSAGDRWGIAAAHLVAAMAAHIRSDVAELERCATLSAELFAAVGDRWGELQAGEWLGALAQMRGDLTEAARLHEIGLRIAEELELWPDVAGHLSWLGWIAMEANDFPSAVEHCERALRLATEQGSLAGRIFASMGLGFARRRGGDVAGAEAVLRWVADQAGDDGEPPPYLPTVLCELGFIAELSGNPTAAWDFHAKAYDVALAMDAIRDAAYSLEGMAGALAAIGRFADAATLLGTASAVHEESGLPASPSEIVDIDRITATIGAALGADFAVSVARVLGPDEVRGLRRSGSGEQ